eukprot:m.51396 g.51396  ORF g.51396 m.51396 type:complete len:1317 (+) comp10732_c0_seq4:299-4249(+)
MEYNQTDEEAAAVVPDGSQSGKRKREANDEVSEINKPVLPSVSDDFDDLRLPEVGATDATTDVVVDNTEGNDVMDWLAHDDSNKEDDCESTTGDIHKNPNDEGENTTKGETESKKKKKNKNPNMRRQIRKLKADEALGEATQEAIQQEKDRQARRAQLASGQDESNIVVIELSSDSEDDKANSQATDSQTTEVKRTTASNQDCIIILDSDDDQPKAQHKQVIPSDEAKRARKRRRRKKGPIFRVGQTTVFTDDSANVPDDQGRVLINVLRGKDEDPVYLAPHLASVVKPHQIGGIKFLYENIVESDAEFKGSPGFGCILAHSMGLGKTIQVVSFLHTVLTRYPEENALVIVPVNTITNWAVEFEKWLGKSQKLPIFTFSDQVKSFQDRCRLLAQWHKERGVLIMGYEMFRILTVPSSKSQEKEIRRLQGGDGLLRQESADAFQSMEQFNNHVLCDPGPKIVVCDEGHRIKNKDASISKALKSIKSKRRVVLTGYPLQNNLEEYWCMVDFVRPQYLGSLGDFNNRFANPISNGRCVDSRPQDVKLMRERSFVLHNILEGFVQRRDESVLTAVLPYKYEFVIPVTMTSFQEYLYTEFLTYRNEKGLHSSLFKAYSTLCKIWNHPDLLYKDVVAARTKALRKYMIYTPESVHAPMKDSRCQSDCHNYQNGWADQLFGPTYKTGNVRNGAKVIIALKILSATLMQGEKILIFTQSLETLDLLEMILQSKSEFRFKQGVNYFRLDGSTPSTQRQFLIDRFNSKNNKDCHVFLLSTKAGGLGINLTAATRVILMDTSWNPCHDGQAVCRVYRYGQTKNVFVYRLVSSGTMERKIYDRQVYKTALASHVVEQDETERHFSATELATLFEYSKPETKDAVADPIGGIDPAMTAVCMECAEYLSQTPFQHSSLFEQSTEGADFTQEEKEKVLRAFRMLEFETANQTNVSAASIRYNPSRSKPYQPPDVQPFGKWFPVCNNGKRYWYHKDTREVAWEPPGYPQGRNHGIALPDQGAGSKNVQSKSDSQTSGSNLQGQPNETPSQERQTAPTVQLTEQPAQGYESGPQLMSQDQNQSQTQEQPGQYQQGAQLLSYQEGQNHSQSHQPSEQAYPQRAQLLSYQGQSQPQLQQQPTAQGYQQGVQLVSHQRLHQQPAPVVQGYQQGGQLVSHQGQNQLHAQVQGYPQGAIVQQSPQVFDLSLDTLVDSVAANNPIGTQRNTQLAYNTGNATGNALPSLTSPGFDTGKISSNPLPSLATNGSYGAHGGWAVAPNQEISATNPALQPYHTYQPNAPSMMGTNGEVMRDLNPQPTTQQALQEQRQQGQELLF